VPQRITIDAQQVRRLVGQQFPQWADLPVRPVVNGGWDNWTFRLGAGMVARLPSADEYALAVDKEHRWLPALAPALPRGWALWKTLATCARTVGNDDENGAGARPAADPPPRQQRASRALWPKQPGRFALTGSLTARCRA